MCQNPHIDMSLGRFRFVCAAGVIFFSAAAALGQSADSAALPAALRAHLQAEEFRIVTSIRGLPLGVRDRLGTMFGSGTLDIAEPGADFQRTAARADPTLPTRRLIAAGCSADNHCLVYYERGGGTLTRRVALFHWTPAETRFEWGGTAPGGLATIDHVRKAILSGAVKGQTGPW
jgi:hypothetical protein